MAVGAVLLAVVLLRLLGGGGDSSFQRVVEDVARSQRAVAVVGASSARLGIAFAYPGRWRRRDAQDVVRLISPERSVAVTLDAPATSGRAAAVLRRVRAALFSSYRDARVVDSARASLSGAPARIVELEGTNASGQGLRIAALVGSGPRRTYAIQVFAARRAPRARVREARSILRSIRFVEAGGS